VKEEGSQGSFGGKMCEFALQIFNASAKIE